MMQTVADIKQRLTSADAEEFAVLERSLVADTRKGVRSAVEVAKRRLEATAVEAKRLASLYSYQEELADRRCCVGLDEVGRGPVAGPLTVGAVILPEHPRIEGLNDSKQVSPHDRVEMAAQIKEIALAWSVQHVEPDVIDAVGMTASLRFAFLKAVQEVEAAGNIPDVILLDGNAMHLDSREINVVKGDARCASIAAASILAKVTRDALMCEYAQVYPAYGFDSCKGYASKEHIEAIKRFGLTPIHRVSFCSAFTQESLF